MSVLGLEDHANLFPSLHMYMYLEYHLVLSRVLSGPTLLCMLVGEASQWLSHGGTVAVGDAVVAGTAVAAAGADAVGVSGNGSWGPWGEERHGGMQWDQDAGKLKK